MTVYVDDVFIHARVGRLTARWCHLMADSDEELHAFAQQIGLRRSWFQEHRSRPEANHYDVTESKRAAAVLAGAVEEHWRDGVARRRARRAVG